MIEAKIDKNSANIRAAVPDATTLCAEAIMLVFALHAHIREQASDAYAAEFKRIIMTNHEVWDYDCDKEGEDDRD